MKNVKVSHLLFGLAALILAADVYGGYSAANNGGQTSGWFDTLTTIEGYNPISMVPLWMLIAAAGALVMWKYPAKTLTA